MSFGRTHDTTKCDYSIVNATIECRGGVFEEKSAGKWESTLQKVHDAGNITFTISLK